MSNQSLINQLRSNQKPRESNAQTIRDLLSQGFTCKEIQEKTKQAKSYVEKIIQKAPEFNEKRDLRDATNISKNLLIGQVFFMGNDRCQFTGYLKDQKGHQYLRYLNEFGRIDTSDIDELITWLMVEL